MKMIVRIEVRKICLVICLLATSYSTSLSQVISGVVYCNETKEPLPFPSIKIKRASSFHVYETYENGKFEIKLDGSSIQQDTLIIAYLGYEHKLIPISQLKVVGNNAIYLTKTAYALDRIDVIVDSDMKFLGDTKINSGIDWGNVKKGDELGVVFENKKKLFLSRIYIPVRVCTYDKLSTRINIRNVSGVIETKDRPKVENNKYHEIEAEYALKESIYVEFGQEDIIDGYVSVDISPFNAVVEADFLVTLEVLKDYDSGEVLFSSGGNGRSFSRNSKMHDWVSFPHRLAMKVGVIEYSK